MRTISPIRSLFFAVFLLAVSAASFAQVSIGISVGFPPPPIPVYEQPICPHEGYIWTPGYWAWDPEDEDYYWVPGTWVEAPVVGYLWTPGYWAWGSGGYFFYEGYWGPRVGWYGGINYGFGYFGHGYEGGRWDHDRFYYNRSVTNVNITEIHNVYNTTIINRNETRISYHGGDGGIRERPSREEESYSRERHVAPVAVQHQHVQEARGNRELRASVNQGKPPIAATQRPASFRGSAVVPAREAGGRYEPPANRRASNNAARPGNTDNPNRPPNAGYNANRPPFTHAKEITPHERPTAPNTGNPKLDQKYRQQQDRLYAKQEQEHQKLQQRQEQEHQRLAQQNAGEARRQQVEQRHQQQTKQLEQRHVQQQQRMEQKQQPEHRSQSGGKPDRP